MAYKAVIFDLDGTLLNTLDDLTASTNAALTAYGLPSRTTGEVRTFIGNGYSNLIARAVPAGTDIVTTARVHDAFQHHYAAHSTDATAPYPGVNRMLSTLRAASVARAVVSNKGDDAVRDLVEHYFAGLVDLAVGERVGVRRKPAPDSVHAVMNALSVSGDDCLYVGDSEVDVATAKAAGVACTCVTWGFRSVDTLIAAGATMLVDTCDQLCDLILNARTTIDGL